MVIIKVCEDNNDIEQVETKQNLVSRRVSSRLQNQPKKYWGSDKKRLAKGSNGNHSVQKKTKNLINTNSSVQQQRALVMVKASSTNASELKSSRVNVEKPRSGPLRFGNLLKKLRSVATNVNQVHFPKRQIPRALSNYPHLVYRDLSNGLEAIAIPVTNEIDQPPIPPTRFTYVTSIKVANNVKVASSDDYGCQCKGNCRTSKTCCAKLNNEFPYVRIRKVSRLIKARDIVFECGPNCRCGPECPNRVSQKGLQYRLEVYRTRDKGWAVKTWDYIPFGALVCEFVGELKRNKDLNDATENDFIFDLDCWETLKGLDGREKRLPNEPLPAKTFHEKEDEDTTINEPEFCIDSGSFGNVARFINHSCEPNMFVQCVVNSHYGVKQARVALFAGKTIRPNQELTYDYGYQLDSVVDADGNIKQLPCYCGHASCRKRLY